MLVVSCLLVFEIKAIRFTKCQIILGVRHVLDLGTIFSTQNSLDQYVDMFKYIDMKANYSRAIPAEWQAISKVFVALGDPHRQRLILSFDAGERLNVGQLAEVSTLARSTVSHHLKVLREAGVLQQEKLGKEVYFWINKPFLEQALGNVLTYLQEKT